MLPAQRGQREGDRYCDHCEHREYRGADSFPHCSGSQLYFSQYFLTPEAPAAGDVPEAPRTRREPSTYQPPFRNGPFFPQPPVLGAPGAGGGESRRAEQEQDRLPGAPQHGPGSPAAHPGPTQHGHGGDSHSPASASRAQPLRRSRAPAATALLPSAPPQRGTAPSVPGALGQPAGHRIQNALGWKEN